MPYKKLLDSVTTTGASTAYQWLGGSGTFAARGFGSAGVVKMQFSSDNTNWHAGSTAYSLSAATSAASAKFEFAGPGYIRALVTTASTTGLTAEIL